MRRGTTPTITVTVDADISALGIHLAFSQSGKPLIVKTGSELAVTADGDVTTIICPLTQPDTLAFKSGAPVEVQIRAIDNGGAVALATDIASFEVGRILQEGVLYE